MQKAYIIVQYGFFYYNHIWDRPRDLEVPLVYRARSRHQPGLERARKRTIVLPCYLLDAAILHDPGIATRVLPENEFRVRRKNQCYLYLPNTRFEERQTPTAERTNMFVMFTDGEKGGVNDLFHAGENYLRILDPEHKIISRIDKLARLGNRGGNSTFWEAQLLLFEIIAQLHCAHRTGDGNELSCATPEPGSDQGFVEKVDALLRTRLGESLTREEIADALHISVSSLSHKYQLLSGKTLMFRRMEMRLELARGLLDGDSTLEEIAAVTGFSSAFHLSRAFKAQFGISPRQYKKQME